MDIIATFSSADIDAIGSCTLDDLPLTVDLIGDPPTLMCTNPNQTVQHGSHKLVVTPNPRQKLPLFFDYISYAPGEENIEMSDVDILYEGQDPSVKIQSSLDTLRLLTSPGDTLDFTFVGE